MAAKSAITDRNNCGLSLFALVFAAIGVGILVWTGFEVGDLRWEMLGFRALFITVFGGIGFGILAAQRIGCRNAKRRESLAALHPDQPWLFRKDWADGKIKSFDKVAVLYPVVFALLWNLFVVLGLCQLWRAESLPLRDRMAVYFLIAFMAVGAVLLVRALVAVLRWWKYRRSVFDMASTPGVIGGQLAGVVLTSVKVEPEDGFHVRLSCVNCVNTKDKSESRIVRNLVWQDEQIIAHDLLEHSAEGSAIPILFQIPYDCRPTDDGDPNSVISWKLTVVAKTPGLDYHATFEVPVFKTAESDPDFVIDRSLIAKYTMPEDPERDLHDAGVLKTMSPVSNGRRFVFPMARTPGNAAVWTMVTILCGVVPHFIYYMDGGFSFVGVVFGGLFGLLGLLLLAVSLDVWFYRSVVDVSQRGIAVTGGLFGIGSRQWIDLSEIVEITSATRMGSGEGETQKAYYDIDVVRKNKTRVTVGKRVPGKRLATAVIRQIEEALLS